MAKKTYTVARGTFLVGEKAARFGDPVKLDPAEAAPHVKNGDLIEGGTAARSAPKALGKAEAKPADEPAGAGGGQTGDGAGQAAPAGLDLGAQ